MTDYDGYIIRQAMEEDVPALLEIYAYYVENTAATFEYHAPSEEDFAGRIARASERYPYLVIEHELEIIGFAFAHAFRERPAYDYAAEVTIYLRHDLRHMGFGKALYTALEDELRRMGVRSLYACVALPSGEDNRLSMDSPLFHEALGYQRCGEFRSCGYKFGKWYTMVWMEKVIGSFPEHPEPLTAYPALIKNAVKSVPENPGIFDDREIRLITVSDEMFRGVCCSFPAEFGMHELGVEEEGVEIDSWAFYRSDIHSMEPLG